MRGKGRNCKNKLITYIVFLGHVPKNKWILKFLLLTSFIFFWNCGIILHTVTVLFLKVDLSVAMSCVAVSVVCRPPCGRLRGLQAVWSLLVSPSRAFLSFLEELLFSFVPFSLSSAQEITHLLSSVTSVYNIWGIFVVPLQKCPINRCYVMDLVIQ